MERGAVRGRRSAMSVWRLEREKNYPLRPIPAIVNKAFRRRLAIFQRFITIEVEFAYHNGDEALLKASGLAIC